MKANSKVHWTLRDSIESWLSDVKIGVIARIVEDSSSFARVDVEKVYYGSSHVLQPQALELSENLIYEEYPVAIVYRQIRQLRTKEISMVKVLWSNHTVEDCTWEIEALMREAYPYRFQFWSILLLLIKFEDEFL